MSADELTPAQPEPTPPTLSVADDAKRRRQRNLAIAGLIAFFVVTVYVVTMLRIGGNIANRPF